MKQFIFSLFIAVISYSSFGQQSPITVKKSTTRHGPEKGSLIIIGGGGSTPKIWAKFTELAGGKDKAHIIVITTASGELAEFSTATMKAVMKGTGAQDVTIVHTGDLEVANSDAFVNLINHATGVFF